MPSIHARLRIGAPPGFPEASDSASITMSVNRRRSSCNSSFDFCVVNNVGDFLRLQRNQSSHEKTHQRQRSRRTGKPTQCRRSTVYINLPACRSILSFPAVTVWSQHGTSQLLEGKCDTSETIYPRFHSLVRSWSIQESNSCRRSRFQGEGEIWFD